MTKTRLTPRWIRLPFSLARELWLPLLYLLTSQPASAQDVLMEHIGDGWREREPRAMDVIGDLDGDGIAEYVLGFPLRAVASVRSGANGNLLAQHYFPHSAGLLFTRYGQSVAGIGDFDGDGVPDYAVGMPIYSETVTQGGGIHVYSGRTMQVILLLDDAVPGELLGFQITGLGDVNGDGFSDFGSIGSSNVAGDSPLHLYAGPNGAQIRVHHDVMTPKSHRSVGRYGDYEGDGCEDYLVREFDLSSPEEHRYQVRLRSGKTGDLLLSVKGQRGIGESFGVSPCGAGDWDGDGIEDIAAGAPGRGSTGNATGPAGVYVFSAATGSVIRFFDGEDYCDYSSLFGWSVSSGSDVNRDGYPDLLASAPQEPYFLSGFPGLRGSAFLFSGRTGALLWEAQGKQAAEKLGYRVLLLDDQSSDGLADWAVLSPEYDTATFPAIGHNAGRLTIYAGAPGDVTPLCPGIPNSMGQGAELWNSGPISVDQNALELVVSEMPPSTPVLLIHGQLASNTPFGGGELCLGTPIAPLAILVTDNLGGPDLPGSARIDLDLTQSPFSDGGNVIHAGDTWAFQALYRDQGMRNTSNALEVRFVP